MKEFKAKVEKCSENKVVLDSTAFYPTSGGQPHDTGMMNINGNAYKVLDVAKDGEDVVHTLDSDVEASAGDEVQCSIDWDRRYAHMRYHSAIHLVDGVFEKNYNSGKITGGQIYTDRARVDFDMPDLDKELAIKIVEKANEVAQEGHEIVAKVLTKEEAMATPNLARSAPGVELIAKLESIRVVDIVGVDMQADGGTHVRNTKEIGRMSVGKFENKGKHSKRVEILLG